MLLPTNLEITSRRFCDVQDTCTGDCVWNSMCVNQVNECIFDTQESCVETHNCYWLEMEGSLTLTTTQSGAEITSDAATVRSRPCFAFVWCVFLKGTLVLTPPRCPSATGALVKTILHPTLRTSGCGTSRNTVPRAPSRLPGQLRSRALVSLLLEVTGSRAWRSPIPNVPTRKRRPAVLFLSDSSASHFTPTSCSCSQAAWRVRSLTFPRIPTCPTTVKVCRLSRSPFPSPVAPPLRSI